MFIVNQDQDLIVFFYPENTVYTLPFYYKDVVIGYSVMLNRDTDENIILGIYDDLPEAYNQLLNIISCKEEFYYMKL